MSQLHTSGPWVAQPGENYITNANGIVICRMHRHVPDAEVAANFHLIGASPALLKALEAIMEGVAGCQKEPQWEAARAAIAQAKGGAA